MLTHLLKLGCPSFLLVPWLNMQKNYSQVSPMIPIWWWLHSNHDIWHVSPGNSLSWIFSIYLSSQVRSNLPFALLPPGPYSPTTDQYCHRTYFQTRVLPTVYQPHPLLWKKHTVPTITDLSFLPSVGLWLYLPWASDNILKWGYFFKNAGEHHHGGRLAQWWLGCHML